MGLFSTPQTQSVDPVELARQQVRAREQENLIGRASLNPAQTIGLLYGQAGRSLGRAIEKLSGYEDPLITQARKLQQTNKNTERAEEEAFKIAEKNQIPFGTSRFFDLVGESYTNYNLPLQGLLSYRLQNADSIQKADQRAQAAQLQTNDTATRQHLANETRNIPRYTGLKTNDDELDYFNEEIHKNEYLLKIISLAATNPKAPLTADYRNKLNDTINTLKTSIADLKSKRVKRQTQVKTKSQEHEGFDNVFNTLPRPEALEGVTEKQKNIYTTAYKIFDKNPTTKTMEKVFEVYQNILKEEPKTQFEKQLARIVSLRQKERQGTLKAEEKDELEILLKKATSGTQTINVYAEGTGTEATDKKDVRQLTQGQRSNKDLVNGVQSLLAKIQANPRSVGFLGFLGRKIGGAVSSVNLPQLSNAISKGITGVGTADLKDVETRSQLLIATLTPITTGDVSGRYTDREQQIARKVLAALEVGQGKEEVLAALRVIREVTLNDIFRNEVDLNVEQKNRLFKTNPDPQIQRDLDNELIGRLIEDYGMSENEAGNYYRQFTRLRTQYVTQ